MVSSAISSAKVLGRTTYGAESGVVCQRSLNLIPFAEPLGNATHRVEDVVVSQWYLM